MIYGTFGFVGSRSSYLLEVENKLNFRRCTRGCQTLTIVKMGGDCAIQYALSCGSRICNTV
jgi:hypothetical protein